MTWIAAVLGIIGAVLVAGAPDFARRRRVSLFHRPKAERPYLYWGQMCWVFGNSLWLRQAWNAEDWPMFAMFGVYGLIALRGVWAWR